MYFLSVVFLSRSYGTLKLYIYYSFIHNTLLPVKSMLTLLRIIWYFHSFFSRYTTTGTHVHYYVEKGEDGVTTPLISFEIFLPKYVEALSLALHWGFLFGCGLHGLTWCTLHSLYIYTFGSILLLFSSFVDLYGTQRYVPLLHSFIEFFLFLSFLIFLKYFP